MNASDYILQGALVLIVLRQVKEHRLDLFVLLAPLGLMGWAAYEYLPSVPTGGNDLWLIAAGVTAGTVLGVASGFATLMRRDGGDVFIRAGWVAAGLWVFGMGFRLVFEWGAGHGLGPALAQFSVDHAITGASAWAGALVLMAFAQVIARLVVVKARGLRMQRTVTPALVPVAA